MIAMKLQNRKCPVAGRHGPWPIAYWGRLMTDPAKIKASNASRARTHNVGIMDKYQQEQEQQATAVVV